MERGICNICGRFYAKAKQDQGLCEECLEKDKRQYFLVKEYIMKNKDASIMDVYFETKVPMKCIKRFIDEERIRVVD